MAETVNLPLRIPLDITDVMRGASAVRELAVAEHAAAEAASALSPAIGRIGDSATRSGGSAVNLVRQLNDVWVQLSAGTPPLQVLAQQGEQLAFAFKEAGGASGILSSASKVLAGSGGVAAVGIAAAATAAGAAYVVYRALTEDSERAAEVTKILANNQTELAPILTSTRLATLDLNAALGLTSQIMADVEQNSVRAFAAINKATEGNRERIAALRKEQGSFYTQWVDFGAELPVLGAVVDALTTQSSEYQAQINAEQRGLEREIGVLKKDREAHENLILVKDAEKKAREKATAAAKGEAAAKREAAAAAREEDRAWKELQAEMKRAVDAARADREAQAAGWEAYWDATDPGASRVAEIGSRIEAMIPNKALSKIEQLGVLQADLAVSLSDGTITLDQYNVQMERLAKATDEVTAADAKRKLGAKLQGAANATGGPNAIVSGIGNAGPWGALVAGIITAVESGLEDLGDLFNDFTISFNNAVGGLGDTLGDNLGDWLAEGTESAIHMIPDLISGIAENLGPIIEGMIDGLAKMIPELLRSLLVDLPSAITGIIPELIAALFDADMWEQAGTDLVNGFIKSFTSFEGANGKTDAGSVIDSIFFGGIFNNVAGAFSGKASGGYVAENGLYRLHAGEEVYNRARVAQRDQQPVAQRGRGRMFGAGGKAYIEVDVGSLADTLNVAGRNGYSFGAPG